VEPLNKALGDYHKDVRRAAVEALGQLGQTQWSQWVKGDDDDFSRLGQSKYPQAVEPLIKALSHGISSAADALGQLKDPRAVEPLIEALGHGYSARKAATKALKEIALLHPQSLIKQWEHIYLTVTKPHEDRWVVKGNPNDCTTRSHEDSGIGLDWPAKPPKTDF
jgi:HEAT repeat protein